MPHMIGPRNQPAASLNEGQARYLLIVFVANSGLRRKA